MQLVYLVDIFEDNHNVVRDRFETYSVMKNRLKNMMKNRLLLQRSTSKFQCISTSLSHISKPWKLLLGTATLKRFASYTGLRQTVEKLDELERYWAKSY